MNRGATRADVKNKDRAALAPGGVVRVDPDCRSASLALDAKGEISQLVCGSDWLIATDLASPGMLRSLSAGKPRTIALTGGSATALAVRGNDALAATPTGVWIVDPRKATVAPLARFTDDSPRVLSLIAIGPEVFAATSEGVLHWPGTTRITHDGKRPAALARFAGDLLVLWEDGALEQWTVTGKRVRTAAVPHAP